MKKLVALPLFVLVQGCTLFGVVTVDEPDYKVVVSEEEFEIREYGELLLVETQVDGSYPEAQDKAFRRLFKYISGENKPKTKISMTAPVILSDVDAEVAGELPFISEKTNDGWRMSFVLPDTFTSDNAPKPTSEFVVLRKVPKKQVATVTFTGRWTIANFKEHSDALQDWLDKKDFKAASVARGAAYNPPWAIPFLRRNEIHIEIDDRSISEE